MSHLEARLSVQVYCPCMELRGKLAHVPQPEVSHLLAFPSRTLPYDLEIIWSHVVLSDGHTILSVQDSMPPVARHEDHIARVLQALINSNIRIRSLDAWKYVVEIHDSLVSLSFLDEILSLYNSLRHTRLKKHPTLDAMCHSIPRCSAQRVGVHRGSRASWTNAKPSVRRPGIFVHQAEPVMWTKIWNLEVVCEADHFCITVHVGFKEIDGIIILLVSHVICKVLHLHAYLSALLVAPHLKCAVAKPLLQSINAPALHCWPVVHCALNDHRLLGCSNMFIEPFRRDV
mmetsp:Transcript_154314/g.287745  ORF Transcript_154314/g.287745 Transcript_154314/m.287745 type:complete len:287 (-) Transcript_154314:496-1356(-)